jgi:glycosyltransferase involved in cell wall biosynthesis
MKIGIDAKWLFSKHISGRLFIQNVLPELIGVEPGIEWHIFLSDKDKDKQVDFPAGNVTIHYAWGGFNMLSNLFVIPRYAKRLGLDAVFFQTFSPKRKSFKSVVFIHDVLHAPYPEYFTWKERLYFKPEKWTLPSADRIVTTTNYVRIELRRLGYAKDQQPVDLAPSGVTQLFRPRSQHREEDLQQVKQKYDLPGSYLLFVGRINERKNIGNLIEALRFVNDKTISLVIAGEKDWKVPQLQHLMADETLRSRILFTGPVTNEELSAIYVMATVFCFPSFAEGMGLPPLEAMASGIPVVVSNTTSIPEVCGPAALYANPADAKEIGDRINELLSDRSLYETKASEGLEWSKKFTWKKTAEGIMKSILAAVDPAKKVNPSQEQVL